ncbi:hypothetical protein IHV10_22155 [Fictibacillus sp. 5RED26]|uniref:hypothetical protein n=1 Tax=Fictibacillus sp. 5RED26 TaxID=2745876 RepID=UPI0018CE1042|nr:hypothetical protein [Fictibacillus sp. 5RED26]MBH0159076.1 hypothetical protein [Fictibacillus sp. 5RED26]
MKKLEVAEEKGLQDVLVFQISDDESVAAYSLEEAKSWYMNEYGISEDELYSDDDIEIVPMDKKVRRGEDEEGLISVQEIVNTYWEGTPFIATTTLC